MRTREAAQVNSAGVSQQVTAGDPAATRRLAEEIATLDARMQQFRIGQKSLRAAA